MNTLWVFPPVTGGNCSLRIILGLIYGGVKKKVVKEPEYEYRATRTSSNASTSWHQKHGWEFLQDDLGTKIFRRQKKAVKQEPEYDYCATHIDTGSVGDYLRTQGWEFLQDDLGTKIFRRQKKVAKQKPEYEYRVIRAYQEFPSLYTRDGWERRSESGGEVLIRRRIK